jgi:endonuclease/exonuclease/phosphatase family metal-dependent hydrolase
MNNINLNKELFLYKKYIYPLEDLSYKSNILPSLKEIQNNGYSGIEPLKSDYSNVLYDGEKIKNIDFLCKNVSKPYIKKGFRILSYNVHSWVMRCDKTEDGKYRNLKGFINFFKNIDADVLCLQEVKPVKHSIEKDEITYNEIKKDFNYNYLISEMKNIGYNYFYIIDGNPGYSYKSIQYFVDHNCIFSKYPIKNSKGFSLPGNRSFMICEIEDFIIINFHGEVSINKSNKNLEKNGLPPKGPYKNILKLQIDLILLFLINYSLSNIIFTGDFNYPYVPILKHKYYSRFKEFTPDEIYKRLFMFFTDTYKYDMQKRITNFNAFTATDFIFINNNLNKKYNYTSDIVYINLSDHFPVYCEFNKK